MGKSAESAIPVARIVVLAQDHALIEAVGRAARRLHEPTPVTLRSNAEVMEAVLDGLSGIRHLVIQHGLEALDPVLVDALTEASPLALVSRLTVPREAAALDALVIHRLGTAGTDPAPSGFAEPSSPLGDDGLSLRYQPIVRVRDGRLVMFEALARWRSGAQALGPDSFVPAIERAGLARLLAAAVTRIAARDIARLPGRLRLPVSINLPVEELEKRDTVFWLGAQIRRRRLSRGLIAIELTETSPVRDYARLGQSVRRLRAAGHEVLIDDFELDDRRRRLLCLPFSGVKLDKGLVGSLAHSARARQQLRRLSRTGLTITAEGVSSLAIWRSLRALGVARAQGFWLARPLPAKVLPAWDARWRSGAMR